MDKIDVIIEHVLCHADGNKTYEETREAIKDLIERAPIRSTK